MHGKQYAEHDFIKAVEAFYNQKIGRKLMKNKNNLQAGAPLKIPNKKI